MFVAQKGTLPGFFRFAPWLGAAAVLALAASLVIGLINDRPMIAWSAVLLVAAVVLAVDLFWQAARHYPEIKLEEDGLTVRVLGRFTQKVKWHNVEEIVETESDAYALLISPHLRSPFLSSGLAPWDRPFQPVVFLSKRTPGADRIVAEIRRRMS